MKSFVVTPIASTAATATAVIAGAATAAVLLMIQSANFAWFAKKKLNATNLRVQFRR